MTRPLHQFDTPGDHLVTLVDAYLAGSASPDELAELNTAIETDESAAAYVTTALDVHATLNWSRRGPIAMPWADEQFDTPAAPQESYPIYHKGYEPKPSRIRPAHYAIAGIAAALLAACGVAVYLLAFNAPPTPDPQPAPNQPGPSVATLIESRGGKLVTPHGYPAEGDDFSAGEYTLTSGSAEFMLTNAVNVKLRGNTRMVMRNNMNVNLNRGAAEFVVPNDAKGFTVHLPDASRIIDLGTAFRVERSDDGTSHIRVTEGRVEVIRGDQRAFLDAGMRAMIARIPDSPDDETELITWTPKPVRVTGDVFYESAPADNIAQRTKRHHKIRMVLEREFALPIALPGAGIAEALPGKKLYGPVIIASDFKLPRRRMHVYSVRLAPAGSERVAYGGATLPGRIVAIATPKPDHPDAFVPLLPELEAEPTAVRFGMNTGEFVSIGDNASTIHFRLTANRGGSDNLIVFVDPAPQRGVEIHPEPSHGKTVPQLKETVQ